MCWHMFDCVFACALAYLHMFACVFTSLLAYLHMFVCVFACVFACVLAYLHMFACVFAKAFTQKYIFNFHYTYGRNKSRRSIVVINPSLWKESCWHHKCLIRNNLTIPQVMFDI